MSNIKVNHVGESVGIYDIVELMSYKTNDGHTLYKGICKECGTEFIARYDYLKNTTKCTHYTSTGLRVHRPIQWKSKRIGLIFSDMKCRCYNVNREDYKWYGAKGICICDEWMNNPELFEQWAMNNGYSDNLTIDRIDENKNYSPDNCRWVTNNENAKYKSTTSLINVDGDIHTGRDWSAILGFGINTINNYIRRYGLDNTIEFIRRYISYPGLSRKSNQSYYEVYMN